VFLSGTVYVQNEEWSARSKEHIPAGTRVKVVHQDGFTLEVEPLLDDNDSSDLLRE
jgi:membrane-bound ClpP family serine protease